ncbi:12814_t:CDS:2, partial [Acaulospora morrowiae]
MDTRANYPSIDSPLGRNYNSFYSFKRHVAISPDGKKIVTFNPDESAFELYNDDKLTHHSAKFGYNIKKIENSNIKICWSLAISNFINGYGRLIALSRFDSRDICPENHTKSSQSDEEEGTTHIAPMTWIISESGKPEIIDLFQNVGGVVRFLESNMEIYGQAIIVAVNASGIYKTSIKYKDPSFTRKANSIEQFFLPKQLSSSLLLSERWESRLTLLKTSIIKNRFLICGGYKNHCHAVEMYSLITGELEMVFQRREPSYHPVVPRGKPIFAISQNELMFAFCRGTNAVTIYMMENGLEVATKELDGQYFNRIISIDFIENDNKLLIILENESEFEKRENNYVFVVWDLFSTSRKAVRQASYSETQDYPLDADSAHRLINSRGKIFAVTNWGGIFPLLEFPGIKAILDEKPYQNLVNIELPTHEDAHPVFLLNGERIKETSTVEQKAIINDIEPWQHYKQYNRLFAYLDKSKQTQLIIGPNTVQVWKIRKNKNGTPQRTLEFIWAKKDIGSSKMRIEKLHIGHCEFVLKLSIPSSKRGGISESCTIHWPSNENTLRSACQSLHFLVNKKECIIGNKNANRCEYLIDHTQQLIRRFIKMHSLFRLTDIRYNIIKDLIQARQESLIQMILSENINGKNSNSCLHIPRLYEWTKLPPETHGDSIDPKLKQKLSPETRGDSTDPKLKQDTSTLTDLQCAIESANSAAIVELLLEYYTDNAGDFNNPGWMFTVTSAIPYLYKHNLGDLVLKIFKKPCFGTTEAYMPPLHISDEDQNAGNNAESVHVINVRPGLVRKSEPKIMNCLTRAFCGIFRRTQEGVVSDNPAKDDMKFSDRKVYMVPLPDFTVLPESIDHPYCPLDYNNDKRLPESTNHPYCPPDYNNDKSRSFLHVIYHEKDPDFYSVPSMNAVTDFKWTNARKYFARQVTIYILFAISFIIRSISYIVDAPIQEIYNRLPYANILSSVALVFMIYFGFYLLATVAVQIKRMGLVKHINLYNIFDL